MTASRDPDRLIQAFLREGEQELQDQVYDAVRAEIEHKRQRVAFGPWRVPDLNKIVGFGLAAAAVVVLFVVGARFVGSPSGPFGAGTTPTGAPEPTHRLVEGTDGAVPITVTIAAPHWDRESNGGALCWGESDACAGAPDGAGIFPFEGRQYLVYADACHRPGPRPDTTATTVDELMDALVRQVHRYGSPPEDITVGGYAGQKTRLIAVAPPGDCDFGGNRRTFALFGLGGDDPARYSQGPRQIEEVWAVDVDGRIVVLVGAYYLDTAPSVVDELQAILASTTFD